MRRWYISKSTALELSEPLLGYDVEVLINSPIGDQT
jgi:hypothetical protein